MAATIPEEVPTQIIAGDTVTWKISLDDFPAGDGWALTYAFNKRGSGYRINITASASANDHLVTEAAATTADWLPGDYDGQAYATLTTERYQVWIGSISILVNFATADSDYDSRSTARKTLDALDAAILKVSLAQQSGTAGGISEWTAEGLHIKRSSPELLMEALQKQRDRYVTICRHEDEKLLLEAGKATGRRILTQFVG